jgi:hypothetical protein
VDFSDPHSGRKGGVWLIANSAESRLTLVLSLSADGLAFDRHFVVRDGASALPIRFNGAGKGPGFQYPGGMWRGDTMLMAYSEGEDRRGRYCHYGLCLTLLFLYRTFL